MKKHADHEFFASPTITILLHILISCSPKREKSQMRERKVKGDDVERETTLVMLGTVVEV